MAIRGGADLLVYFGHHKAASTWSRSIVRDVCIDMGLRYAFVTRDKMFSFNLREWEDLFSPNLKEFVDKNKVDFLCCLNANFERVKHLEKFRGFHVIRDPRDLIVSAYFSHLYSHPTNVWKELVEHRKKLERTSKDEGILLEMEFSKQFLKNMFTWNYSLPNVLELKMEDLIKNPYKKSLEIFRFLGILDESESRLKAQMCYSLPILVNRLHKRRYIPLRAPLDKIPAEKLLGTVYQNDFSKKSGGRNIGEEDMKSHYRKGVPGDWKNHFSKEHIQFFKDNYNHVLIKLGYESNSNW